MNHLVPLPGGFRLSHDRRRQSATLRCTRQGPSASL